MDGSRFDDLARALAAPRTRRGVLGALAGLAAGLVGAGAAAITCPPDQVRGAGNRCLCRNTGLVPGPNGCPCPGGLTRCGSACIGPCTASDACHVAGTCDPNRGACANPPAPAGTPCGAGPSCSGGVAIAHAACDGAGTCAPGATTACAPYVCNGAGTACLTTCGQPGDCATGNVCNSANQCVPCTPDCAGKCGGQSDGCGGTCTTCPSGQTCAGTTCCLDLQQPCTDANQCCQGLTTACEAANGGGTQTRCCRPPAFACTATADCCGQATCGTTNFGPNHCCLAEGQACDPASQLNPCCDGAGCFGGVCCTATCAAGDCGQVAKCGALIECPACPTGQVCHNGTCCTPQSTAVTCNSRCGPVTDNCGQTVQCTCPSLKNCVNGQCVDCAPLGATCGYPDYANGCCQTETTYCSNVCCHRVQGSCAHDYECCDGISCGSNGRCCFPLLHQDCTSNDQCCDGLVCAGYCCKPKSAGCAVDSDCCSNHCVFGACACIALGQGTCTSDSDCCAGGTCCNGTCRDLQADPYNCGSCGNDCGKDFAGNQVLCCAGIAGQTCCAHL